MYTHFRRYHYRDLPRLKEYIFLTVYCTCKQKKKCEFKK